MRCPNCDGLLVESDEQPGLWSCADYCGYTEDRGTPPSPPTRDGYVGMCGGCDSPGCIGPEEFAHPVVLPNDCGEPEPWNCTMVGVCERPDHEPEPYEYRCPACETSFRGLVTVCHHCGNEVLEVLALPG